MKKIFVFLFLTINFTIFSSDNIIRKINVTGNVERQILPNIATVSFKVKSKKETITEAKKEVNGKIENFKKELVKQKINFTNFETTNVNNFKTAETENDDDDNDILDFKGILPKKENFSKNITGYNVNMTFLIRNNDFNKLVEILGFSNDEFLQSIVKDYDENAYIFTITENNKSIDDALKNIFIKFTTIKNKLIANNIDEKNIILGEYSIEKVFGEQNNNIKNYFTVINEFKITINNINQLNNIISLASENDINVTGNINFNISNREEIETEMYNEAFKQAKDKATSILKSSKMILGSPIVVSEEQNKMIDKINENWSFRAVPLTANYSVGAVDSPSRFMSAKSLSSNDNINYKPKPITLSQNISIIYEIKESEEK